MRETVEYIVTDFDGTFTNTADLLSEPGACSSDSPVLEELLRTLSNLAGVIGCTHRATDGYGGFLQLSAWNQAAPKCQLENQKIAAIEKRLRKLCQQRNVSYLGTSTEYDGPGVFTGVKWVIAAENSENNERELHSDKKLVQEGKNGQLLQIIEHIAASQSPVEKKIIVHFYDDNPSIVKALRDEKHKLAGQIPANVELKVYSYNYTTVLRSVFPRPSLQVSIPGTCEPTTRVSLDTQDLSDDEEKDRWDPSFMIKIMAHPSMKIIAAVFLVASIIVLGVVTGGGSLIPTTIGLCLASAGLFAGGALFGGQRWAEQRACRALVSGPTVS